MNSPTAARNIFGLLLLTVVQPQAATPAAPAPSPAQVTHPVSEADLARIILTPEAERRLGIRTAPVQSRDSRQTRLVGAEVILPLISPTNAGTVPATAAGPWAQSSTTPAELMRLAQAQIDADVQVEQARIQVEVAEKALTRVRQLVQDKAGAVRVADEAKGQFDTAEANLRAARSRRDLFGPALSDAAHRAHVWVRAPVYVGDLDRLDLGAEVRVGRLTGGADSQSVPARPVPTFAPANAAAGTVDLFYEVTATNSPFRLGQRVGVHIPMDTALALVAVPWSSIVQDTSGGAWVYERTQPQTYVRRRVLVHRINGVEAELARGPGLGTPIVVEGTAELFGTEFGMGK